MPRASRLRTIQHWLVGVVGGGVTSLLVLCWWPVDLEIALYFACAGGVLSALVSLLESQGARGCLEGVLLSFVMPLFFCLAASHVAGMGSLVFLGLSFLGLLLVGRIDMQAA